MCRSMIPSAISARRWACSRSLEYTGGKRGWVGDNPFIFLDTKKIQATGWKTTLTIEQGIVRTLQWLQQNQWVYESGITAYMNICVFGLWHLGSVTAACCARTFPGGRAGF